MRPPPPPPPPPVAAAIYARAARGAPAATSYEGLTAFLTASPWNEIGGASYGGVGYGGVAARMWFTTPANARRIRVPAADRVVIVRRLERRDRLVLVDVDGSVFALARCTARGLTQNACLTLRNDLAFEVPHHDPDPDHHFAKPPR